MKLTKKLIEQMVREAVKQYAVDPDQFFGVSPDDPQYMKLKDLVKTDPEMAKMLGYNPEITGDEIAFSTGPVMRWFFKTYNEYEDSSKEETTHEDKVKHTLTTYKQLMYDALDPDRKANFGGGPTYKAQQSDPVLGKFHRWFRQMHRPMTKLAKKHFEGGETAPDFFLELSKIVEKVKKRFPSIYTRVNNTLNGASE